MVPPQGGALVARPQTAKLTGDSPQTELRRAGREGTETGRCKGGRSGARPRVKAGAWAAGSGARLTVDPEPHARLLRPLSPRGSCRCCPPGLCAFPSREPDTGNENKNGLLVPDGFYCVLTKFMMAFKVEKTHALPHCCSAESLVSSLGLGIFCLVADRLLRFSIIQQNDWLRALSDNVVHGVIGMWSWAVAIGVKKKTDFGEVLLAGFLASVIDIDHFFLARSLSLKAALTLPRRPSLHCSTVTPIAVLSVKLTMYLCKLGESWCFLPWMFFLSWTSHHIRDGIRHGLWICPFGKTSPLPFWFYVISTWSLPHMCSFLMHLTGTRQIMSSKYGMRVDV